MILFVFAQITSVNFAHKKPVVGTGDCLGVLAGELPASVSFASFESSLTSDALKVSKYSTVQYSTVHFDLLTID